jgi:hypothetical protein
MEVSKEVLPTTTGHGFVRLEYIKICRILSPMCPIDWSHKAAQSECAPSLQVNHTKDINDKTQTDLQQLLATKSISLWA